MTLAAPPHTSSHSSPHASPGSVPAATTLERNLSCLGERQADLARRLREMQAANIAFEQAADGLFTAQHQGRWLASRHRPRAEAERIAASVDIVEHALFVVGGFGVGHHVAELARRIDRTGVIIVYEPDLGLLRAVLERIDHSDWLRGALIVFLTDPTDRAALPRRLAGAESIVAQGVAFLEHPADRARLQSDLPAVADLVREFVAATKTTLLTTLVRAADTTRNLLGNLDHYALGPGIAPLRDAAKDRPAVVVSAGPSLQRNLDELARPGVRDRCVIVAVQTVLKPLLQAGVRPHFVTALDYHEISRNFYDDLDPQDLRDITLVCEPKVNRAVVEAYPGPVRCVGSSFLDRLLGPLRRDMGTVPAGSTVAHLSFYLAQFLGCDPIVLVGQDLGFTDGLYYGPGAAIHDQWAAELNAFNTIDMMEWSRVARMKRHLRHAAAQDGSPMLVDEQMATYLSQFERDFSTAPQTIIDAQGGGVAKRHTTVRPLEAVIADALADPAPLPRFPTNRARLDQRRLTAAMRQIASVRDEIERLRAASEATTAVIAAMLEQQHNAAAMDRHFRQIHEKQREVARLGRAQEIVNLVNQLGVFKRIKADRRLELLDSLTPLERQREELLRDRTNLDWLAQACAETTEILTESMSVLRGEAVNPRITHARPSAAIEAGLDGPCDQPPRSRRVAALVACDPLRGGLLQRRDLAADLAGRTLLQRTLERLGRCRKIDTIILLAPDGFDAASLLDVARIDRPVVVHHVAEPIFDAAHKPIAAARMWSDWCWRGGIGGMTVFDEIVAPRHMAAAMDRFNLDAALIVGPDWPLLDFTDATGCDALIARYLEQPNSHRLVFSQAPPGLCGVVIERSLMREMASRARQFTLGSMLSYIPSLPQLDPTSKDACIKLPTAIRSTLGRFIADSPSRLAALRSMFSESGEALFDLAGESLVATAARHFNRSDAADLLPRQIEIELTTRRTTRPFWRQPPMDAFDLPLDAAQSVIDQCASRSDIALTFGGRGDPLLHPHFAAIARHASEQGCTAIHVRTDLPESFGPAADLLDLPLDVISIELHGECADSYRDIMGVDGFDSLRGQVDALLNARTQRAGDPNALALPWIVPRLCRCRASLDDLRNFCDRWLHYAGAVMIDSIPATCECNEDVIRVAPPLAASRFQARQTLQVHADGVAFAAATTWDRDRAPRVESLADSPLSQLWPLLRESYNEATDSLGEQPTLLLQLDPA